jgi:outer membrane immunogenic protein
MKNSLLSGLGLVAGVGLVSLLVEPTTAADLAVKTKAPAPVQLYNWTGCYGGAHFGSQFVQQDWGAHGGGDDTGLMVGGQLGCNYQISTWVFGVQGDINWSNATGTHPDQVSLLGLTDEWKKDSLASVTGRFGYAWDRLLTYAKAGGAWSHDKYDTLVTATGAPFSSASATRSGWTVGAGFEYAITNNLSMFFEYDFYDFGTKTIDFSALQSADIGDRESIVKVGGNWKFKW